jgi:riboflavin biosynthesis pyrimidine reductase
VTGPRTPDQTNDETLLWQHLLRWRLAPGPEAAEQQCATPSSATGSALWGLYTPLLHARGALHAPHRAATPTAWLLGQLGLSLDGCVATASGDSYFVTGPASLVHLHRLRALCDAVLVGAGTVAADNPQLTTRLVPGPNPVRVLLDPRARLDGQARALTDGQAPTLWLCDARHAEAAHARLPPARPAGTEVLAIPGWLQPASGKPGPDGDAMQPDMARAVAALAARGLRVLLVEGGGVTVSRCMAAGLLNRLHLVFAPVLIGNGRTGLQFPGPGRMADCLRPHARPLLLGDDVLWDLDLDLKRPA